MILKTYLIVNKNEIAFSESLSIFMVYEINNNNNSYVLTKGKISLNYVTYCDFSSK